MSIDQCIFSQLTLFIFEHVKSKSRTNNIMAFKCTPKVYLMPFQMTKMLNIPHTYSVFYSHWLSHSNVIDNKYYFYMRFQFLWFFSSNFRYQSIFSSFFLLFLFFWICIQFIEWNFAFSLKF